MAPAPDGASAHASDEPVASGSSERRATVQEETVASARTRTTGSLSLSPLGKPTTQGSAGVSGSAEPDDCRTDASHQALRRRALLRFMTHPGVGALTALAFVLIIGKAERRPMPSAPPHR